ncbi:cobaltochelatase CobN [Succiniclasticum ruminis]|uniref:Cobaltochelatase CobN n=1 Tax=Succiniclasticum ruminis TaxID=40841 RepID=A0A1G6K5M0_9FIRM|nr:cobaltochelatase subunit CobN [Succiniclasticum ruminis]SDC26254.1 cobaltochelatase CobN [Succiniclasticum ruminis]
MDIKIIYLTNDTRRYAGMKNACLQLQDEMKISDLCMAVKLERSSEWNYVWERKLRGSSLVVARFFNNIFKSKFWEECSRFLDANHIPYVIDAVESASAGDGAGVEKSVAARLRGYTFYGGAENFRNFWLYASSLTDPSVPVSDEPKPQCWAGIYHPDMPDGYMTDLAAYREQFCKPDRPVIGLLFYRDEWIWDDLAYPAAFIREAEQKGCNALAVFTNQMPDESLGMPSIRKVFNDFFTLNGETVIDVLVSAMKFSHVGNGSLTTDELEQLGVPVLTAYTLLTTEEDWRKNPEGLNAVETSIAVALPEFDGAIHGVPIAGRNVLPDGAIEYRPMPERTAAMVDKAVKWAKLHRLKNEDKKIALIFHNYPPKNYNIGSASGMDSMESATRLLARMQADGYKIDFLPESAEEFIRIMTSHATNDLSLLTDKQAEECQKLSADEYAAFFATLPEEARQKMTEQWGEAPGDIMLSDEGNILVPGTMNGNIFMTVQPARQYGMDPARAYHDPTIAPTHQYLAFYYWLREVFKADAVIHLGTHGNLEWLPGKATGLDRSSYSDIALGSLPNIYPYLMTISGEGVIAKRRSSACLIGYLPAPVAEAGAFDELAELEKMADEYSHFQKQDSEQAAELEKKIIELAHETKLDESIAYDETKPFTDYLAELHEYIEELQDSEIHVGLHVLGQPPEGDILIGEVMHLLRLSNGPVPSLYNLWAEKFGLNFEELEKNPSAIVEAFDLTGGELLRRIRNESRVFVTAIAKNDFTEAAVNAAMQLPETAEGPEEWQQKIKSLGQYIIEEIYPRLAKTTDEMEHALAALSGKYVPPGPSGSPSAGGVDLLPSGRNFYGVDPRALPSQAGWMAGKKLGDRMIEKYITDEGKYPENIGMVLWSGPNMRSSGQDIAEFLYLLGIKPVWQKGSLRVTDLEAIPLDELKRPRIDVTARISGLFRDTLPHLAELMDKAVLMAAKLDESDDDNFVRKHIREDSEALQADGTSADDAWRNAAFRVFGDAPGTYGSGINVVLDAKNWESEKDLADVYVRWGGHVFGGGQRGVYQPELFKKRLAQMELTVKNEENHDMNILSSDDYNGFHGGMIAAVKSFGQKTPVSYVGDSANRGAPKIRTVAEEMKRVVRTESLNPKYIEGLMQHGYKGAMDMANRLNISFQWDATSSVMEDWMYNDYAEKYAFDPKVQQWMKKVNPWALQNIAETLLEAEQRQMWNADDETKEKLQELYLSVEGEIEEDDEE